MNTYSVNRVSQGVFRPCQGLVEMTNVDRKKERRAEPGARCHREPGAPQCQGRVGGGRGGRESRKSLLPAAFAWIAGASVSAVLRFTGETRCLAPRLVGAEGLVHL